MENYKMNKKKFTNFTDALHKVSIFAEDMENDILEKLLFVRDVYGKFRILVDLEIISDALSNKFDSLESNLSHYASSPFVQLKQELFSSDGIFESSSIVNYSFKGRTRTFRLLDRQITGAGWINSSFSMSKELSQTNKLAFFGLKGGVGRSSALVTLSYDLAKKGKKVVLIDLDLESPGLSSLLLPDEMTPEFGVIDWIIESSFDNDNLRDIGLNMICHSPLSTDLEGQVLVVPAMGNGVDLYMDKLSRAYNETKSLTFEKKLISLLEFIVTEESPDHIFIDSRSGLHDIAALTIVGLSDTTLLFGVDSNQSWHGYAAMFSYWQSRIGIAESVRERLKMVQALMPESDQLKRADIFNQKSHALFSDYLYDDVLPLVDLKEEDSSDYLNELFSFEEKDEFAPHYPIRIKWNSRFQEFDPLLIQSNIITNDDIKSCFGALIDWVETSMKDREND